MKGDTGVALVHLFWSSVCRTGGSSWGGALVLTRSIFLSNSGRCLSTRWDCLWLWVVRRSVGSSCLPIIATVIRWSPGGSLLLIWYTQQMQTNASLLTHIFESVEWTSFSRSLCVWSISHISSWKSSKVSLVFQVFSWPVLIAGRSGIYILTCVKSTE